MSHTESFVCAAFLVSFVYYFRNPIKILSNSDPRVVETVGRFYEFYDIREDKSFNFCLVCNNFHVFVFVTLRDLYERFCT